MPLFEVWLQILIAFTIESGKSSAYFIRRAFIFLLEQILFLQILHIGQVFQSLSAGKGRRGIMCPALSASCPFPCPPEIRFTPTKSHSQSIQNPTQQSLMH